MGGCILTVGKWQTAYNIEEEEEEEERSEINYM